MAKTRTRQTKAPDLNAPEHDDISESIGVAPNAMRTDPPRQFDVSSWRLESHVREALELAPALSEDGESIDALGLLRAIVQVNDPASSKAFPFVATRLKKEGPSDPSEVKRKASLGDLMLVGPLHRSFARQESLSSERVWGSDLVTIVLLASDDPSYVKLRRISEFTLDQWQDQWFRFLEADNRERRSVERWQEAWAKASVPRPDQRSEASRTYLMTWNPDQPISSKHPSPDALHDIKTFGSAILPWRISNEQNVFVGERVFLHRQGKERRGLVGAGRIAGPVDEDRSTTTKKKATTHTVYVRWTHLFTEPIVALKSLEEKGDEASEWSPRRSGNVLSAVNAQVAAGLWRLAVEARDRGIAGFLSDRVSGPGNDLLDVEREAHAVARVAASVDLEPPLSFGVFGDWGSGKTFFMELVHEHIAKLAEVARSSDTETAFHKNIVQIRFNAWHYIETNLWASLVDQIFTELDLWLRKEAVGHAGDDIIEDVFGRLETPRRLLLESVSELVDARQQKKDAKTALDQANKALSAAREQTEALPTGAFDALRAVLNDDSAMRKKLAKAAVDLGIPGLQDSARQLSELVEQARGDGNRLRLLSASIVRRLGQPFWLVAAVLLLVLAPIGMSMLGDLAGDGPDPSKLDSFLAAFRSGIAQVSAAFAAAGLWVGRATHIARKAVDELQKYDRALDKDVEGKLQEFNKNVGAQTAIVDEKTAETERARERFDAAEAAVQRAAERREVSARRRLSQFIQGKVASGEYAKELSLVSTVRKDFEQLTDIMMVAAKPSEKTELDREEEQRRWEVQLEEFDFDDLVAKKLIEPEEFKQLKRNPWLEADIAIPHFERVILYVDDLDRCPPEKVVDVLQAIHLLLYFPLFVVVVAVDSRWVSNALIDRYPGLLGYRGEDEGQFGSVVNVLIDRFRGPYENSAEANGHWLPGRDTASPRDYLEKIFQIPYWVRSVEDDASRHMVKSLVGGWPEESGTADAGSPLPTPTGGSIPVGAGGTNMASSAGGGEKPVEVEWIDPNPSSLELTIAERRFLSRLAPHVNPSPRTLRRFVNVYRVLRSGLKDDDLREVTRESGDPTLHRALIVQLAIVSGAPHLSEQYFVALRDLNRKSGSVTSLKTDIETNWSSRGPREEVAAIAGALGAVVEENDNWAMIERLKEHIDTVRRYSFGGEPAMPSDAPRV